MHEKEVISMKEWKDKANKNVEKWGVQTLEVMTLAMMEELGELTQAILQYRYLDPFEDTPIEDSELKYNHIIAELDDLAALMYQMKWVLEPHRKYDDLGTDARTPQH